MPRKSFLGLLKHELRVPNKGKATNRWWLIYPILAGIIGIIFYTMAVLRGSLHPQHLLFITFVIPFFSFGLAFAQTKKEWDSGTISWWLALPYSRTMILTVKYVAILIFILVVALIGYVGSMIFALYATLLNPIYGGDIFYSLLKSGVYIYIHMLCMIPLIAAMGVLTGIITKSKWYPLAPLMWVALVFSANFTAIFYGSYDELSNFFTNWIGLDHPIQPFQFNLPIWTFIILVISLLVGYVFIKMSSKIVEKHINL